MKVKKKKPFLIPNVGGFFCHDDRFGAESDEEASIDRDRVEVNDLPR